MAVLVSHAMRRYPTSPSNVYTSCGLRDDAASNSWLPVEESESSLSRSMRYADPWLYSNINIGHSRAPGGGGVFLAAPALVLCNCPDYLNGTKRSSAKGKQNTVCKKCKGTRLPLPVVGVGVGEQLHHQQKQKFGTVRCYPTSHVPVATALRAGTLRVASTSRPSILPPKNDPYDFMRKSRLSSDGNVGASISQRQQQQHKIVAGETVRRRAADLGNAKAARFSSAEKCPTVGRKSILECDINPYELMSSDEGDARDASITMVNGQRIRVKPPVAAPEYEDVDVPKMAAEDGRRGTSPAVLATRHGPSSPISSDGGGSMGKPSPRRPKLSSSSSNNSNSGNGSERESESNRFKSILKKTAAVAGTFGDTDSNPIAEQQRRYSSPSPGPKSGSHFYLPMPAVGAAPRKKVQFLVVENSTAATVAPAAPEENAYEDAGFLTEEDSENGASSGGTSSDDDDFFKNGRLRRSVSERFIQEPSRVVFLDTMAIRTKSRRNDTRETFIDKGLQKLDGTSFSNGHHGDSLEFKARTDKLHVENVSDYAEKIQNQSKKIEPVTYTNSGFKPVLTLMVGEKEEINNIAVNQVENDTNILKYSLNVNESKKQVVPQCTNTINSNTPTDVNNSLPPTVPPRKRSNNKQPLLQFISNNSPIPVGVSAVEIPVTQCANKTVVQINSLPEVHKLQIKNELFPSEASGGQIISSNPQRKTSILINGDDCYCTVNVNDDIPLYQSSVVVRDSPSLKDQQSERKTSSVYIKGCFGSSESASKFSETKINRSEDESNNYELNEKSSSTKILVVPNDCGEKYSDNLNTKENATSKTEEPIASQIKENKHPVKEESRFEEDIQQILKDPVEAVRRNLVPHICGKQDASKRHDRNINLNDINRALTESGITSDAQIPLNEINNFNALFDDKDYCSDHSSSTQYELMDLGSDCYTDNSNRSSVTEEELANRTKFYELLADSAAIEVSEFEDHHYESIKVNSDPIYEEIEIPPPLPSNPPPASLLDDLQLDKEFTTRSIFEGASKYDILSYLVDAKERGIVQEDHYSYNFDHSHSTIEDEKETAEPYNRVSHLSTVSDSSEENSLIITNGASDEKQGFQRAVEVERNDSGLGSETSKTALNKYRIKDASVSCEDCDSLLECQPENEPLLCKKCVKKRSERKEIIMEIVETEEKYSRDLQIVLEEFYQPMLVAGLLTPDQLSAIFLNVEELLENSQALAERLRDAVEIAIEQGDEDLLTVNIGKLFIEAAPMLHAFESYCIRQGTASLLLASLEKDKELLRIFLRVSQMENTMLRRMNLNSFLMVPVQRVTKYPLLLARLHKVTPVHHENREQLKEAQHKIELHLNHMNSETKDVPSKLWRRISNNNGRRSSTEMDLVNIKLRKLAVDVLEWNHDEAKFALEGKLLYTQPTDNNWRKGRTIKLSPINALLVTNGKVTSLNRSERGDDNGLIFARHSGVREAALLLVRDKNSRYSLLREPLFLDRCIIAADPAWQSYFEVQELLGKDTFIFKAEDEQQTQMWYRQLQYHAQGMGTWRKRRNALANIMINGMGLRS